MTPEWGGFLTRAQVTQIARRTDFNQLKDRLTVDEVCQILDISESILYSYLAERNIVCPQHEKGEEIMIPKESLLRFLLMCWKENEK